MVSVAEEFTSFTPQGDVFKQSYDDSMRIWGSRSHACKPSIIKVQLFMRQKSMNFVDATLVGLGILFNLFGGLVNVTEEVKAASKLWFSMNLRPPKAESKSRRSFLRVPSVTHTAVCMTEVKPGCEATLKWNVSEDKGYKEATLIIASGNLDYWCNFVSQLSKQEQYLNGS